MPEDVVPGMEETPPAEETPVDTPPAEETPPVEGGENTPLETPPPAEEKPAYVTDLEDRLAKAEKALEARAGEQPDPNAAPKHVDSPEFFSQMQKDLGFTRVKGEDGSESTSLNSEQFSKGLLMLLRETLASAKAHAEGLVHGSTSEIRTDAVITDLAAKTPDIRRYAPQIKEYLKKRYSAKDQSNPEFIMDGYYRAKGMGGGAPAKPQDRSNVRVITPSPANRAAGGKPSKPLGAIQKGMIGREFKDERELRAFADADLNKL